MTLSDLAHAAREEQLGVFGAFHTGGDSPGPGTLVLLGPDEPGFWPHVTASPEFRGGQRDPLDRWSARVITNLADQFGGSAFFPFGAPAHPFVTWALRGGQCFVSPVSLLVHPRAGLKVSFRGAILLPGELQLPEPAENPCGTCANKPCLTACPADALTAEVYDTDRCHAYLDTGPGAACMSLGCAVRNACPAGQNYHRLEAQSAFHMEQFHPCP